MADGTRLTQAYVEVIGVGLPTEAAGTIRLTQGYVEMIGVASALPTVRVTQAYVEVIALERLEPVFPAGAGRVVIVNS